MSLKYLNKKTGQYQTMDEIFASQSAGDIDYTNSIDSSEDVGNGDSKTKQQQQGVTYQQITPERETAAYNQRQTGGGDTMGGIASIGNALMNTQQIWDQTVKDELRRGNKYQLQDEQLQNARLTNQGMELQNEANKFSLMEEKKKGNLTDRLRAILSGGR